MPPISISKSMANLYYTYDEGMNTTLQGLRIGNYDLPITILFNICKNVWKDMTSHSGIEKITRSYDTDGYSQIVQDIFVVKSSRYGGALMYNGITHLDELVSSRTQIAHLYRRRIQEAVDSLKNKLNNDDEMLDILDI